MGTTDGWGADGKPLIPLSASEVDFSTRSIRVTPVRGARSFVADKDGNLMGVVIQRHWKPGINEAQCWLPTGWDVPGVGISDHMPKPVTETVFTGRTLSRGQAGTDSYVSWPEVNYVNRGWTWTVDGVEGVAALKPTPVYANSTDPAHDLIKCMRCGFHGYLLGSLDYASWSNTISGIVEAFGTVSMGRRGFRASHARILALFLAPRDRHEGPRPMPDASLRDGFGSVIAKLPVETEAAIRARYPDVPIYTDLDLMLADFPTEPPRAVS